MVKKSVLITGASRGIGAATAEIFAQNGFDVIINFVTQNDKAQKLVDRLRAQYGSDVVAIKADVSNELEVQAMVDAVIEKYGKIDVLINNAGIVIDKDFNDRTLENFKLTFGVNVFGTFLVTKYVSKHMLSKKRGKIINLSSTNGIDTLYPTSIDYDATKSAVISLTKNMALEFAPYINVNSVAPGWVDTDMNANIPEADVQSELNKIALHRPAQPEEIASVIYFLASDGANYINGETIRVDGGMI